MIQKTGKQFARFLFVEKGAHYGAVLSYFI